MTTLWSRAKITLAIHPRFGEEVTVQWTYGARAVRVETDQNRRFIMPTVWTDLKPRPSWGEHAGIVVHLDPWALHELAGWIEVRTKKVDKESQRLAHVKKCHQTRHPDGEQSPSETIIPAKQRYNAASGRQHRRQSASAVVGQARSPNATGGRDDGDD
jgi:hypothetical protein